MFDTGRCDEPPATGAFPSRPVDPSRAADAGRATLEEVRATSLIDRGPPGSHLGEADELEAAAVLLLVAARLMRQDASSVRADDSGRVPHVSVARPRRAQSLRREPQLSRRISRELAIEIIEGVHRPGERIPIEHQAFTAFGVSRTPYREAIRILTAKGLLEARTKTGTFVRPRSDWRLLDADMLIWLLEADLPQQVAEDFRKLRQALEPMAAELAAALIGADELRRIGAAVELIAGRCVSLSAAKLAIAEIHVTVIRASRNPLFETFATPFGMAAAADLERSSSWVELAHACAGIRDALAAGCPQLSRNAMSRLVEGRPAP